MGDAFGFAAIVMIVMLLAAVGAFLFVAGAVVMIAFSFLKENGRLRSKGLFALPISLLALGALLVVPLILFYLITHWSRIFPPSW